LDTNYLQIIHPPHHLPKN